MIADKLRQAILQAAIQGKLTKQLKSDGTAKDLLAKIQAEKFQLIKEGKIKKERQIADISKEDIPCEIPANWLWCKLGDIAFVTKLAGFEYTSTISVNLKKTGIPLFKGKNIQNGKLDFNFESYIPENISDSLLRSQINKRCLLTPYVGTIGNIAIFDGSFKAHLGSNVGKIELFNNIDSHVYEEYLLIYLKSDIGLSELKKHKKATAQESISIEAIRDVDIPLPPLAEQKRIVARIESLLPELDKLEKEETRLATMQQAFPKAMKNSLLQAAIQGKLTKQLKSDGDAEDLLANIQAERKKLIKKGKIKKEKALPEITKEEEPFDIPDNWVWVRLGNIVYNRGQKKPDNEFTYIDISSINNKRSELGTLSNVLSPNKAPSRARKMSLFQSLCKH
jgi:type I restriction enzyme, S subunit